MLSSPLASLAFLPAAVLATASVTSLYATEISTDCDPVTGVSTVYTTETIHSFAANTATSVVYVTPTPIDASTTITITSTSVIPTSSGFYPVADTPSTYPGNNSSAPTTLTCTAYETIFTTRVEIVPDASTSTLAPATLTGTSIVIKPSYAACSSSNLISTDPIDGKLISDVENISGYSPAPSYNPNITNAYDCCASCIEDSTCAYSYFAENPVAFDEHYNVVTGNFDYSYAKCMTVSFGGLTKTCDASNDYGYYARDDTTSNNYTVSNGNCGYLSRYIQPRCEQTKGGYYICDVDCSGTSVEVASPTTSLPACPYASA